MTIYGPTDHLVFPLFDTNPAVMEDNWDLAVAWANGVYETWQQESPMIYLPNEDNELPDDGHTYCEHGVPIDAVPCTRCAPEDDDESYVDIPF